MANLTAVKIFPTIGIARLGNSPEYFLGPELPFPAPPPTPPNGTYKDDQCRIKRQAQRFRLYGFYDDNSVKELTLADGAITWTVHVVNAKPTVAATPGGIAEGVRIDPGPRTLSGANDVATFANGKYTFGTASTEVPLGEAHTDDQGRLTVVGGYGHSASLGTGSITDFRNDSWYDDVSDGSVNATFVVGPKSWPVAGAWVICPPPHYAPSVQMVTTLYDVVRQVMIDQGKVPKPGDPSFVNDILPILRRAIDAQRVVAGVFSNGGHGTLPGVIPPGPGQDVARGNIFAALAKPGGGGQDMPLLKPFDAGSIEFTDVPPTLRDFQYKQMERWSLGFFTNDWPPVPPPLTPDGLTRAALDTCVGAVFFPGIEATHSIREFAYSEPFRLDQSAVQPGDVTKEMARPWQGDFTWCRGGTSPGSLSWWPAARPEGVFPLGDPTIQSWVRDIADVPEKMINNWFRLGFILPQTGTGDLVEMERHVVCKDAFIITDRNTFGKDEIDAMLTAANPAIIDAAFYVVVEGFTPGELEITNANPAPGDPQFAKAPAIAPAAPVTGMSFQPTALKCENDTLPANIAQRFTFFYQVRFTGTGAFPVEHQDYPITATIKGLSAQATLTLTTQPNPFMLDGPISWLSTDVRVFQIRAGDPMPLLPGVTMGNTPDDAYTFIQTVIKQLPKHPDAFQSISQDETASKLELSEKVGTVPVFNFALCRVRYFAKLNPATAVRVFFRLFQTASTGTNYEPATTYKQGAHPGTKIPVLGVQGGELVTIPCFAEKRINVADPAQSLNAQNDTTNVQNILPDATGKEVDAYFGCWLDINQPGQALFPIQPASPFGPFPPSPDNRSIRDLVRGLHQCLVAEIAFEGDPISIGVSPASSDKLAQRNLAIVPSDNPGSAASHRVQHTFDIKPTRATLTADERHDELMIDWGTTPRGSLATIYLPQVKMSEVLELAGRNFNLQTLQRVDDHTVQCKTGGVTYVPIPQGVSSIAGLLTVDLPAAVRKGQVFKIVVRQVTTGPVSAPPSISQAVLREAIRVREERAATAATGAFIAAPTDTFQSATAVGLPRRGNARRVLGAFQITVPVRTADTILPDEQRGLAITRAILRTIPDENRWNLPFRRYVTQIADRVDALGGDSRADGGSPADFGSPADSDFRADGDSPADGGERDHDRDEGRRGCIGMIMRLFRRR
jgi:L-lysine epsilon oxidase-like protein